MRSNYLDSVSVEGSGKEEAFYSRLHYDSDHQTEQWCNEKIYLQPLNPNTNRNHLYNVSYHFTFKTRASGYYKADCTQLKNKFKENEKVVQLLMFIRFKSLPCNT